MATEPTHISEEHEISLKELILIAQSWVSYLWSKWAILLIAGILGSLLGLGYAIWKKPQYTATTTFVLEGGEGKSGLSQYAGMAAMVGIDLGGGTSGLFQGDNIFELYKSRTMLAQTLLSKTQPSADELLIQRYIRFRNVGADVEAIDFNQPSTTLSQQNLRFRDSVITTFVEDINDNILSVGKPDKKLSVIKVEVKSPDEVFSKVFNENLVRRVNEFYIQTKIKKSTESIAILESKVDSVRAVMTSAIYSAARASDATPNINPTRQVQRIAPTQEAQFAAEANQAILSHLLQNLELTKMNMLQEQPLIQMVDHPVYPLEVNRVGKVKGIVLGGLIFGFIMIIVLILRRYYQEVMAK